MSALSMVKVEMSEDDSDPQPPEIGESSSPRHLYRCNACGKTYRKKCSLAYHKAEGKKRCVGKLIPPKQHMVRKGTE